MKSILNLFSMKGGLGLVAAFHMGGMQHPIWGFISNPPSSLICSQSCFVK